MAADEKPYLDPAVEYARKPESKKSSAASSSEFTFAHGVWFSIMWIVFGIMIVAGALGAGWAMWLAAVVGIVGGFVAACIGFIMAMFNISF